MLEFQREICVLKAEVHKKLTIGVSASLKMLKAISLHPKYNFLDLARLHTNAPTACQEAGQFTNGESSSMYLRLRGRKLRTRKMVDFIFMFNGAFVVYLRFRNGYVNRGPCRWSSEDWRTLIL
jgi:hypothetical protein